MTPETALSFPPGDVQALVGAVTLLLGDEPRRQAMGVAGRRMAQERYAWDAIGRRLLEIYDTIAA
jgi:glycosyltransferase involved in cell wall biosynthesis